MSEYDINNNPFGDEQKEKTDISFGDILKDIETTISNTPGGKIYHRHECTNVPACNYWINAIISKRNPHLNQTTCPLCQNPLKVVEL